MLFMIRVRKRATHRDSAQLLGMIPMAIDRQIGATHRVRRPSSSQPVAFDLLQPVSLFSETLSSSPAAKWRENIVA